MDDKIAGDLHSAAEIFHTVVWPALRDAAGWVGRLEAVEHVFGDGPDDIKYGVDYWYWPKKHKNTRRVGLAVRNQWLKPGQVPYDTFSIRSKRDSGGTTELEKRQWQVSNKFAPRPMFVVQSYVCDRALVSAGLMMADTLYGHVLDEHWEEINTFYQRRNCQGRGDADFIFVPWRRLLEWDVRVRIVPERNVDSLYQYAH